MPSKIQASLSKYQHNEFKIVQLPSLNRKIQATEANKSNEKVQQILKKQSAQNHFIYSRHRYIKNPIHLLSIAKRATTEQSANNFNELSIIEKNIIMQIKDIDTYLESQRQIEKQKQKQMARLFSGFVFLTQINEFVIQKFYDCLKVQSESSTAILDGFDVPKLLVKSDGSPYVIEADIVKKVLPFSHKLLNKSIKNIEQYDQQKNYEYEKNFKKQWSLFKNNLPFTYQSLTQVQCQSQKPEGISETPNNPRKFTFIKSFKTKMRNESKSTNLFQSKISSDSKNTFVGDTSFLKHTKKTQKYDYPTTTVIRTQPFENKETCIENNSVAKLTKQDIKVMLMKHKNLVSIWIPPASYPQLFGIFCYKIIKVGRETQPSRGKQLYKCKLNRYFFYKYGLGAKVFNSIIEYVTHKTNLSIESLQIIVDKTLYSRVFSKMGWVLKFWESANKVKASYYRQNRQKQIIN